MASPRPAAGSALGALAGSYPNPASGHAGTAGPSIFDDFISTTALNKRWDVPSGGTNIVEATTATEIGVVNLTTGAGASDLAVLGCSDQSVFGPALGWQMVVKVAVGDVTSETQATGWSGLVATLSGPPTTGTRSFVGFRYDATGSTVDWYGVCRNGSSETTLDLGVLADTTWRTFAWVARPNAGWTAIAAVDFYMVSASTPSNPLWTLVGSITTNIPSEALCVCISGLKNKTGTYRSLLVDHWSLGGAAGR